MLCYFDGEYIFSNFALPVNLFEAKEFLREKSKRYIRKLSKSLADFIYICPCRYSELSIGDYFTYNERIYLKGRVTDFNLTNFNICHFDDISVMYIYVFVSWRANSEWEKVNLTKRLVY